MSRHMEKISALPAKAEATNNKHEAEAYFAKAQELATAWQVDLEIARAGGSGAKRSSPTVKRINIGRARQVGLSTLAELFMAIGEANGVRFTVAKNSTYVNAFGFDEDIRMSEALYAPLAVQMMSASLQYLTTGEHKILGVHGKTARVNFQCAFASRIGARLHAARNEALRNQQQQYSVDHIESESPAEVGFEVVLAGRQAEVDQYFDANARVSGTYRGTKLTGAGLEAWLAGEIAGNRAALGTEARLGREPVMALVA